MFLWIDEAFATGVNQTTPEQTTFLLQTSRTPAQLRRCPNLFLFWKIPFTGMDISQFVT